MHCTGAGALEAAAEGARRRRNWRRDPPRRHRRRPFRLFGAPDDRRATTERARMLRLHGAERAFRFRLGPLRRDLHNITTSITSPWAPMPAAGVGRRRPGAPARLPPAPRRAVSSCSGPPRGAPLLPEQVRAAVDEAPTGRVLASLPSERIQLSIRLRLGSLGAAVALCAGATLAGGVASGGGRCGGRRGWRWKRACSQAMPASGRPPRRRAE